MYTSPKNHRFSAPKSNPKLCIITGLKMTGATDGATGFTM